MNTPTPKEMIEEMVKELEIHEDGVVAFLPTSGEQVRSALTRLHDATVEACKVEILDTKLEQGVFYNHTDAHGALNKAAENVSSMRINQLTER